MRPSLIEHNTGRFAPSPTGRMHLGNVLCALLSWLSARSQGGRWLLRIEDIDAQRCHRDYALQLMDDLDWLGLHWDGEPLWQSRRSDVYEHYYTLLVQQHMTYPCYCTRADLLATQAPHESDGRVVYPGTCRPANKSSHGRPSDTVPDGLAGATGQRGATRAAATRLIVPNRDITFTDRHYGPQTVNLERQVGDFIIRRKDGAWAYQLAVVVDDALSGVTEVVRGRDLLLSTPQQIYLAQRLGFREPAFAHHPLLCNAAGQRLSKRDSSTDMAYLRERFTAQQIIGFLAHAAGLRQDMAPATPNQLLADFGWSKVSHQDIRIKGLTLNKHGN